MTEKNAVIFDLDGTLIHSAPDLQAAINFALSDLGRDTLDLETVISFIGNGVEKLVERSLLATGQTSPELQQETLMQFLAFYEANSVELTQVFPGVVPLLTQLKEHDIPLAICTNKPTEAARTICDALDLSAFFKVIVGADPGQAKKPNPTPLFNCCAALELTPHQAVYIGDSSVDYQTASNAKMPFGFFTGGYLNAPLPEPDPVFCFDHWSDAELFRFCCKRTGTPGL